MTEERVPYGDERNTPVQSSSKWLEEERRYYFYPTIASAIGLNEAIFLDRLQYWLIGSKHRIDGRRWVYNTYENWQKQLPFWSVRTIERTVKNLCNMGVVLKENFNRHKYDRTLWYTIDYARLDEIAPENSVIPIDDNPEPDITTSCQDGCDSVTEPIPEKDNKEVQQRNNLSQNQKTDFASVEPELSSINQDVDFAMGKEKRAKSTNPAIYSSDQPPPSLVQKPARSLPAPDPDYDPDKAFDSIPAASDGKPFVQGALVETNAFARQHKQLDGAPDLIRRVSFLVKMHTGFIPFGTKQSWFKQITELWDEAEQNEELLVAGLAAGEAARRKGDLTFSGPRAYNTYVRNAKSRLNQPKPVTLRRKTGTRPNHQQVAINANGTVRVKL